MKILVFDNYDSFTYNLVHYIEQLTDVSVDVHRNDQISLEAIGAYDKILLSPGPGVPSESGLLLDLIKTYHQNKSIFGVCLGMQAIGEAFGGHLLNLSQVFHGVATPVNVIAEDYTFNELPKTLNVGRYHSWVVSKDTLPKELQITAIDETGEIMALRHTKYDVGGVQFHPESILTENGLQMIKNWLNH